MIPHMIFCRGGNPRVAKMAIDLGFKYGTRSDDQVGKGLRCDGLIDINWKKYDWDKHKELVQNHRPMLACVPDVTEKQMLKRILAMMCELEEFCDKVVVIPKLHKLIPKIPSRAIIGVSVPSKYAGFLPHLDELRGRRIHMLGGSPKKQLEIGLLYKQRGIDVFSVDGNGVCLTAGLKKYWHEGDCNWRKDPRYDYYQLIEKSLINWRRSWNRLWGDCSGVQRTLGGGTKGFFDFG